MSLRFISDVIFRTKGFFVSLNVFMNNDQKDSKFKKEKLISAIGNNGEISVSLNSYNSIILAFNTTSYSEESRRVIKDSTYISNKYFNDLYSSIIVTEQWLRSKQYEYLYRRDANNKLIGLGGKPPFEPTIYKANSRLNFIKFSPSIITDIDDTKYEGVAIYTNSKNIVALHNIEYLRFTFAMKQFLLNSHLITLQLLNNALSVINITK